MIKRWGDYTQLRPVWEGIPGFFDYHDVYDEISDWAPDGAVLVEVGSFLGRSACYMGERIQASGKRMTLLCVDQWPSTYQWGPDGATSIEAPYETFIANVRQSGLTSMIVPIRANSVWASQFVRDNLDFVWIDAGHEYEHCRDDIAAWLPKIRPGGIIAGHDYNPLFPGVVRAVNEAFPVRTIRKHSWWVNIPN